METSFNVVDVSILLFCGIVGVIGYWRGFLNQLAGTGGALGGLYLAYVYTTSWAPTLTKDWGLPETIAEIVAFALLFTGTYVGMRLLGWALTWAIDVSILARVNRALGGFFGVGKGLVFAAALAVGFDSISLVPIASEKIRSSSMGSVLLAEGHEGADFLRTKTKDFRGETSQAPKAADGESPAPAASGPTIADVAGAMPDGLPQAMMETSLEKFTGSLPEPKGGRARPEDPPSP